MALLRAPSQFAPGQTGGPVTPSCCGCCCCCCCAGTAVATTIALPLLLHQVARPDDSVSRDDSGGTSLSPQDPATATDPAVGDGDVPRAMVSPPPPAPGWGRLYLGMAMSALAIPAAVAALAVTQIGLEATEVDADVPSVVLALVALIGVAVGGYLVGGVRKPLHALIPVVVLVIATVAFLLEVILWAGAFLGDGSTGVIVLAVIAIVMFPILTTTLIVSRGRRRRRLRTDTP